MPRKTSLRDILWDLEPGGTMLIGPDRAGEKVVRVTACQIVAKAAPDRLYSVSKEKDGVIVRRVA